jgi:hypothetical protein
MAASSPRSTDQAHSIPALTAGCGQYVLARRSRFVVEGGVLHLSPWPDVQANLAAAGTSLKL